MATPEEIHAKFVTWQKKRAEQIARNREAVAKRELLRPIREAERLFNEKEEAERRLAWEERKKKVAEKAEEKKKRKIRARRRKAARRKRKQTHLALIQERIETAKENKAKIIALYDSTDKTYAAIARIVGLSPSYVGIVCKEYERKMRDETEE